MVFFLGKDLVGVRIAFLSNYSLALSLLKHRGVGTFLNLKISNPNRGSPLNNSIDNLASRFKIFLTREQLDLLGCVYMYIYILCHIAKLSFTYLSAAFQFGVKMQDGQNTQKQNRDQKLNKVLHQINKILTRKRWILVRVPTTMKMTCSLEGKKLRIWNLIVVLVFKRSFLL